MNQPFENDQTMMIDEYYSKSFLTEYASSLTVEPVWIRDEEALKNIPNDSVAAIILDLTLNHVYEYEALIAGAHRALRRGGVLLSTASSVAPSLNGRSGLWGFTAASIQYLFEKYFQPQSLIIKTYGNALAGRFLLSHTPASQLTKEELQYADPFFPVVIGVKSMKE